MTRRAAGLLALLLAAGPGCRGPQAADPFRAADSLLIDGRYAELLPRYTALRESLAAVGDTARLWRAQVGWAETLLRTGRLDSARIALDDARVMAGDDTRRLARTRYVRSLLLHRQGKLDSALGEARQVLALSREAGNRELEVDALSVHGTVHSLSGRYRVAAAHAESALAGERRLIRPPQFLPLRMNNLGVEYRMLGRVTEAEAVLQEGLATTLRLPSPRLTMLLSGNLSSLRRSTGRISEALAYSEMSLRAAQAMNDAQGLVVANENIGAIHLASGNYAAARRHLERSLAANTPVRFAWGKVAALEKLGRLELAERRPERAGDVLQQALALADAGSFGDERVTVRAALAMAAIASGRAAAALRWADQALALSDSVGALQARLAALEARAAALEALGRGGDAGAAFLEAIELLESWRGRIALGDLAMAVAEPHWASYEGAIRTLVARGDAAAAFAVGERAKARLLLELMADRDASRPATDAAGALRGRIRVLARERSGARSDSARNARDHDIAAALDSLAVFERRTDAATERPASVSLERLRADLVTAKRTLLAYFWGERDVYGWRIGPDGIRVVRLGSTAAFGAQVDFLRSMLETPAGDSLWREPARRAWAAWVAPLAPPAGADLLIVPDGPLAHVPFEILLAPGDSVPLGASRRIAYGPSASVLHALTRRAPSGAAGRALLAVGNPAAGNAPDAEPGEARAEPLKPLPHAEAEARALTRLFRSGGADLLVGRRATRRRWLALEPERYRYLHFAAHAEVSDRRPERTRVLLADGPLDLTAIRGLALRAELVTLSACETALGQRVRGEGVIGLPHAFLAAGAGSVLVTLWRVDDRATAAFMESFYGELHAGRKPAEALRLARERLAGALPARHPAYWAPFVLVGVP